MIKHHNHTNIIPIPGPPPIPPYDNAGWTLAFQMGVQFDRILEPFSGPFENVTAGTVKPPAGKVTAVTGAAGYLFSHQVLDSFVSLNRLLGAGEEAYWLQAPLAANGRTYPSGTLYVSGRSTTEAVLQKAALDRGVSFEATSERAP